MKFYNPILLYVFFVFSSYAGDGVVGNGGNVLICPNNETQAFHNLALDLYELDHLYGLHHQFDLNTHDTEEVIINTVLNKISELYFDFAVITEDEVYSFDSFSNELGFQFEYSNDITTILPKDCRAQTVVYQRLIFPYYMVSPRFKTLTNLNRAALKFHEALYSWGILENPSLASSDATRRATAYLFSQEFFQAENKDELVRLIKLIK
jgi:hypothetical protein